MKEFLSRQRIGTMALAVLSLFCFTLDGMSKEKPAKDARPIQEVDGYTIKVVRIEGGLYGYEIRRGGEILVRQEKNPFTGSGLGLKGREAALKTATWLVKTVLKKEQTLPENRRLPVTMLSRRPIPRAIARELGIPID